MFHADICCSVFAIQSLRIRKVKQISKSSKGVSEETSPHEEGDLEPAAAAGPAAATLSSVFHVSAESAGPAGC